MADEKYTRCPGCRTIFRVMPQQLTLRNGQVRCGHCRAIFDGVANLVSLAPVLREEALHEQDLGPPTVTLRNARALEPAPTTIDKAAPAQAVRPRPIADDAQFDDYENRFAWDRPRRRSRGARAAGVAAIALLVLLFAGQLVHHARDAIAAHFPAMRPSLVTMCGWLGCEIRPLREIGALSIEASDLQADAAHKGLLTLAATVRNRAPFAVAHPYLELTLTDAQDQVVVRRAISPPEYLSANADVARGIAPNGEVAVKLFIDASATSTQAAQGYRLYLFYP